MWNFNQLLRDRHFNQVQRKRLGSFRSLIFLLLLPLRAPFLAPSSTHWGTQKSKQEKDVKMRGRLGEDDPQFKHLGHSYYSVPSFIPLYICYKMCTIFIQGPPITGLAVTYHINRKRWVFISFSYFNHFAFGTGVPFYHVSKCIWSTSTRNRSHKS